MDNFQKSTERNLAAEGSRPRAAGTAIAALKLATLSAVLALATCSMITRVQHSECYIPTQSITFLTIRDIQSHSALANPIKLSKGMKVQN